MTIAPTTPTQDFDNIIKSINRAFLEAKFNASVTSRDASGKLVIESTDYKQAWENIQEIVADVEFRHASQILGMLYLTKSEVETQENYDKIRDLLVGTLKYTERDLTQWFKDMEARFLVTEPASYDVPELVAA